MCSCNRIKKKNNSTGCGITYISKLRCISKGRLMEAFQFVPEQELFPTNHHKKFFCIHSVAWYCRVNSQINGYLLKWTDKARKNPIRCYDLARLLCIYIILLVLANKTMCNKIWLTFNISWKNIIKKVNWLIAKKHSAGLHIVALNHLKG